MENKIRSGILALIQVAGTRRGCADRAQISSCVFIHHLLIHYQMSRVPKMTPSSHAFYSQSDSVLSSFMTHGSFRIQLQNKQENDNSSISCWLFFFSNLRDKLSRLPAFHPSKITTPELSGGRAFILTTSELLFSNIDYKCASWEFLHSIIAFFISFSCLTSVYNHWFISVSYNNVSCLPAWLEDLLWNEVNFISSFLGNSFILNFKQISDIKDQATWR